MASIHSTRQIDQKRDDVERSASLWFWDAKVLADLPGKVPTIVAEDGVDVYYISGDSGQVALDNVALDARPVVSFNRPVNDASGASENPTSGFSDSVNDSYTFTYTLTQLLLSKWKDGAWQSVPDVSAYWQATSGDSGTQVELFGDGPFSFCRNNTSMSTGDEALAPAWTPYTDSFLAATVGASDWPIDMTPETVDFSTVSLTAYYGPAPFVHEGLTFSPQGKTAAPVRFKFSNKSASTGGGYAAPITNDPLALLEVNFGGAAQPKTVRALRAKSVAAATAGTLIVTGVFADGHTTPPASFTLQDYAVDFALGDEFKRVTRLRFQCASGKPAYLLGFSYLTAAQVQASDRLTGASSDLLDTRDTFEPDVVYRITASVDTTTVHKTDTGDVTTTSSEKRFAFFKTDAPPADLTPYVARVTPEDGTLLFRSYDLVFECNENYIQSMYGRFAFSVLDENGAAVTNADGTTVTFSADYRAGSPSVAYTTLVWLGALEDNGANPRDPASAEGDDVFYATLPGTDLLPADKTLDAVLAYDGEAVYTKRFRTSRFSDFAELVGSYEAGTVWHVDVGAGADLAALNALLGADSVGDLFDEAWYSHLAQRPAALPECLEVSKLVREDTGAIVGLAVMFPEAVDPARVSVSVTGPSGTVAVTSIRSADGARVLLAQAGGGAPASWAGGDYVCSFTYRLDLGDDEHPVLYKRGRTDVVEETASAAFAL